MTDTPPDDSEAASSTNRAGLATTAITSAYKVLGELTDHDGVGVLGQNNAGSGTPIGVQGAVPNASGGYGLYTDDDAKVDGTAELATVDTSGGDFTLAAGNTSTNDATNVVQGHASNGVQDGAVGAVIGGGGRDDGSLSQQPNDVYDDYGTIAGGKANQAGSDNGDPATDRYATVGGGTANTASGRGSTVGGGRSNAADGGKGTVAGGQENTAGGINSTVAGGRSNSAGGTSAAIGGGFDNVADSNVATVGGGSKNDAYIMGTVGGGNSNSAGRYATVGGGRYNDAGAWFATIAGGGYTDSNNKSSTNNIVYDDYGTIGGGGNNRAGTDDGRTDDRFATVSGGSENVASSLHSVVSGGWRNTASGSNSTVGGGEENVASGGYSNIGGGEGNTASGTESTVGGGQANTASGTDSTVGGGIGNTASGQVSTVPGGWGSTASGESSFAAGRLAKTATSGGTTHDGAFVWGDRSSTTVRSESPNQFVVQAGGGVKLYSSSSLSSGVELPSGSGSWSSLSARSAKRKVRPVDSAETLRRVESLEISRWEYDKRAEVEHMGPMAEEFHEAFRLGGDPERIATIDADGVALAAIQGLAERLVEKDQRIDELEERVAALETQDDTASTAP